MQDARDFYFVLRRKRAKLPSDIYRIKIITY